MAGGASTTYYDIVTRYRIESEGARRNLDRYGRSGITAGRGLTRVSTAQVGVLRGLRSMRMLLPGTIAGMVGFAGVGMAATKTFRNLDAAMTGTMALASQLNLAFAFDADPVKNFAGAMEKARGTFRDMVKDAAALPGELSDFVRMSTMIAGPIFQAGGNAKTLRESLARLAIITPMIGGGNFADMASGFMMMLQGRSIARNPLTATMLSSKMIPGNSLKVFNALTAAEQLAILNRGLARFADNPLLRRNVIHLFATQFGTLSENLFGISGVLGRLGKRPFDNLLTGLEKLNTVLDKYNEARNPIARAKEALGFDQLSAYRQKNAYDLATQALFPHLKGFPIRREPGPSLAEKFAEDYATRMTRLYVLKIMRSSKYTREGRVYTFGDGHTFDADRVHQIMKGFALAEVQAKKKEIELERRGKTDTPVNQSITVNVELQSDDSPEAIAVKMERAIAKAARAPTVAGLGKRLLP